MGLLRRLRKPWYVRRGMLDERSEYMDGYRDEYDYRAANAVAWALLHLEEPVLNPELSEVERQQRVVMYLRQFSEWRRGEGHAPLRADELFAIQQRWDERRHECGDSVARFIDEIIRGPGVT